MRELPKELVEQAAEAMFRSRQTADWDEVCRDDPDMANEVRLLAGHAIAGALDYLSSPENVTGLVLATHEPRPIQVGDWVYIHAYHRRRHQVKAIDDGVAFLKIYKGNYTTEQLCNLTPCEAPHG